MTWYERVLLTAALLGVIGGLAGSVVVLRRQVLFAQALSHATFPGAIVAVALGLPVALGAAVAGLVLVVAAGVAIMLATYRWFVRSTCIGALLNGRRYPRRVSAV